MPAVRRGRSEGAPGSAFFTGLELGVQLAAGSALALARARGATVLDAGSALIAVAPFCVPVLAAAAPFCVAALAAAAATRAGGSGSPVVRPTSQPRVNAIVAASTTAAGAKAAVPRDTPLSAVMMLASSR